MGELLPGGGEGGAKRRGWSRGVFCTSLGGGGGESSRAPTESREATWEGGAARVGSGWVAGGCPDPGVDGVAHL